VTGLKSMTARFAKVNGVNIAFRVQGEGPPLVLVMGYRLSSAAWPEALISALALQFSVITLDNRGTGLSDKPVDGYAIANMALDLAGLLDELKISRTHILGYSMGGAIALEFERQFPDCVSGLVLCATMCGGPRAIYAPPSVVRVMRELDGLKPDEIARQIWKGTLCVPKIRFCNIDGEGRQGQVVRRRRRGAQSRDGEGRPCSEIDGSSTHYNRRHIRVGSGAGALRQTRSCGRDIRGGSSR